MEDRTTEGMVTASVFTQLVLGTSCTIDSAKSRADGEKPICPVLGIYMTGRC